jgi:methyl-accepting chemotaxis protein
MSLRIFKKSRSLKFKLGLALSVSTFLVVITLIVFSVQASKNQAIISAKENAHSIAKDYAGQVRTEMEQGLNAARVMAQFFAGVKDPEAPLSLSRDEANTVLKKVLTGNAGFFGTYMVWEPNEFDQQDSSYTNTTGHDGTGRFIPYWSKDSKGAVLYEATLNYDTPGQGDYYQIPKRTLKELAMDPVSYLVQGERLFLVSLEAPIMAGNKFYGISGIDISIKWLQKMANEARLYNGQADIQVISPNGTLVAASEKDSLIGKNIREVFTDVDDQLASLRKGEEFNQMDEDFLRVYEPVQIGGTEKPWQVGILIPADVILAEARSQSYWMIFISGIMLMISLGAILYFTNKLIKPLEGMVEVTNKLSQGDLEFSEVKDTGDEIGRMGRALNSLARTMRKTTTFANQIGQGNIDAEFKPVSDRDILGNALLEMRNNLKQIAEEDKKREWANKGIAFFGEVLRNNNDDLSKLSFEITSHIVKYLDANQGALFIIQEDEKERYLELTAAYAWGRQKFVQKKLNIGQGLAGQAVQEGEFIYMTEVPQDFLEITSGLGNARPKCVLIVPLKINDVIYGVIELASFKPFATYQIEFVQKIGESIATTLSAVKVNQKTKMLLEEAKISSEERRAVEEELRQNQEELQATQEEMARTMRDLKKQNEELVEKLKNIEDPESSGSQTENQLGGSFGFSERNRQKLS